MTAELLEELILEQANSRLKKQHQTNRFLLLDYTVCKKDSWPDLFRITFSQSLPNKERPVARSLKVGWGSPRTTSEQ